MIRFYIEGIGLCGPGLEGWKASLPILAGGQDYVPTPTRVPPSTLLPANEHRRAAQIVKIALAVGSEAFTAARRNPASAASVFASSGGDGDTIHEILNVLASPNRELSPTRFHNSVHNAAAGYWSIATGATTASTSLCCHDDSFAAGLLDAAVQTAAGQHAVVLIAYDVQYPAPLKEVRPIGAAFAAAFILSPQPNAASLACIELELEAGPRAPSEIASPELEALRRGTPAARCLPLLVALVHQAEASVTLNYLDDMALTLRLMPMTAKQPE
jgi:hypothetical protein